MSVTLLFKETVGEGELESPVSPKQSVRKSLLSLKSSLLILVVVVGCCCNVLCEGVLAPRYSPLTDTCWCRMLARWSPVVKLGG